MPYGTVMIRAMCMCGRIASNFARELRAINLALDKYSLDYISKHNGLVTFCDSREGLEEVRWDQSRLTQDIMYLLKGME
ncbi:hypothetical protein TNCV_129631 [Trichonephila clavipes]|nr:hypothetical protein TNCV_129631 [Trichonephila clavipes]